MSPCQIPEMCRLAQPNPDSHSVLPLRRGVLEINPTLFSDRFKYVLALFIVVLKCWKIVLEK